MRPVIAVTPSYDPVTQMAGIPRQYFDAVLRAGGLPLMLPRTRVPDEIDACLDLADGVLITGGADVSPDLYGQRPHPALGQTDRERDMLDVHVARRVCRDDLPTLAVCRGMQVLTAALGETLWQDLPSQCATDPDRHDQPEVYEFTRHAVDIVPESRLARVTGDGRLWVNSRHHQAVRSPAPGFVITARSVDDGIVEAVEVPDARFLIGVQWHPEMLAPLSHRHAALFEALVRASI